MELRVLVDDPRHGLRIRVDIGRGNVLVVADQQVDSPYELPRQALEILYLEVGRIAVDAPLGTAERQIDHRRLPRHQ